MEKLGSIHGRFQIFHKGHLEYALQAKERCEHLVVGITNPDTELTRYDPADPERSLPENNPFSYYERHLMIKETLPEEGIPLDEFDIVPFPINFPEKIKNYCPLEVVCYTRVFEPWNYRKIEILKEHGFKVAVLFEGTVENKCYDGTTIRKLMLEGGNWEAYVPRGTAMVVKSLNLIDKLKAVSGEKGF